MQNVLLTFIKILGWVSLIIFLTFLSQTGGLILLFFLLIRYFLPNSKSYYWRLSRNWSLFFLLYFGINFLIVPQIAKNFNKVPMPVFSENLKPHNLFYVMLNRHYVTPKMRNTMIDVATKMNEKYPNTPIYYLDGSHPIGEPRLYPHIRHKSGRKLDICFFYKNRETGESAGNPSFFGYGFFAPPLAGERDLPAECARNGNFQYGLTGKLVAKSTGKDLEIDPEKNEYFMRLLTKNKAVRRIFIEPHLKQRFNLEREEKVRFHGCWAVRHDDHAHVEVR